MDREPQILKRAFWVIGAGLLLVGLIGWYMQFADGIKETALGSVIPWGLWIAVYIYLIGLSAGAFLISSLVYVFNVKRFEPIGRVAVFTAFISLLMALLIIWADLGHMGRFWHVFVYPNFGSAMTWMLFLYTGYFLLLVTELWLLLRRDLVVGSRAEGWRGRAYRLLKVAAKDDSDASEARDRRIVRVLAIIGVPVAVLFHGGVGALFAVVSARPAWNSGLFPIIFLVSALAGGGALLLVIVSVFQDGWTRNREIVVSLGQLVLGLLVLDVVLLGSEMLVSAYGGVPGHVASLNLTLSGPYWWVFWLWQIALGTIVPIVLLASRRTNKDPRWVALAGLLIAVGFIGVRLNIVIPSLATEEIAGLAKSVSSSRITTDYFPTVMEWLVAAGVIGLGLLLFGLGEMLLPQSHEDDDNVSV